MVLKSYQSKTLFFDKRGCQSINHHLDQNKNSIQLNNQIRVSIYLCAIQRHIGDGSAVDISHGYAVKLDALSTTGSILT